MQRREGLLWAGASPQEGFAQKPGEGWKGRRASESLKGMRVDGSEQRQECKRG